MAAQIPPQLQEFADGNTRGPVTVRALLSWFGAERRGYSKVKEIRKALNKVKLRTEPDFEEAWIDGEITFIPKPPKAKAMATAAAGNSATTQSVEVTDTSESTSKPAAELTGRIKIGML